VTHQGMRLTQRSVRRAFAALSTESLATLSRASSSAVASVSLRKPRRRAAPRTDWRRSVGGTREREGE